MSNGNELLFRKKNGNGNELLFGGNVANPDYKLLVVELVKHKKVNLKLK